MKQLIKKLIKYYSKEHQFLITSHGQTASMWLAAVLNRIPDIFCSHGYAYPPKAASLERLTREEIKFRISCFGRFETLTLDQFFSELKSITDKRIVGNVLAFFLGRLFSKVGGKLDKKITVVNLVRHPITRITSTCSTWTTTWENKKTDLIPPFVELDFNTRCDHLKNFLVKKHTIDFSKNANKVFMVSLLAMEDITRDIDLANSHGILNLKYEDITTDKEVFKNLINHITKGTVKLSSQLLDDLIQTKKMNTHNNTGISEANNQYLSWEAWQQDVFGFVMERSNMLNIYDKLDYDFSFVS